MKKKQDEDMFRLTGDMIVARVLMFVIDELDTLIFGERRARAGYATESVRELRSFVYYSPSESGDGDRFPYGVYGVCSTDVEGISEAMRLDKTNQRVFRRNGDLLYRDPKRCPQPTRGQLLVMSAAHEVRHRMQYDLCDRLRTFTVAGESSHQDPLVEKILQRLRAHWAAGTYRSFDDKREEDNEFDSRIIELLVLHKFNEMISVRSLRKLEPLLRTEALS